MTKRDMLHQTIGRIREMEGAIELLSKALMGAEALRNNAYNALSATRLKFHAAQQEAANLKYLIAQAKKSKSK